MESKPHAGGIAKGIAQPFKAGLAHVDRAAKWGEEVSVVALRDLSRSHPAETLGYSRLQRLQYSADGRGDGAKARDKFSENFRRERLVTVALGQLRGIVHLDH